MKAAYETVQRKGESGMAVNKLTHAAQRAAFGAAIDTAIKAVRGKGTEHMAREALKLIDMGEPLLKKRHKAESFEAARRLVQDPDGKWMQFAYRTINEVDPHILKMNALNLVYEGMLNGYNHVLELRETYDCNMPWILLFDPTASCNLHCKGCWAAEYGKTLNLTYEEMDKLVTEGEELGIHWYMCTGGEPMCRKNDLLKLAAAHQTSVFHLFTNGTLIDEAFCKEVQKVGNMAFFISIEGIGDATDDRRGKGVYEKVIHAMDLMKEYGLLFGTSICYTSQNYKAVTDDAFLDMLIGHGVRFNWYFHYMPVGNDAAPELLPTPEQRRYMIQRIRYLRSAESDIPFFPMDFQNDGQYVGGCIAGGRNYFHINSAGDAEPCVFIHYSDRNIHSSSILEILRSPLFMAYRDGQPFNKNHLRPCPMLENPEKLRCMVHETSAHSTDLQSPESVDHLCDKCQNYADAWQKAADEIWDALPHREGGYQNYKTR